MNSFAPDDAVIVSVARTPIGRARKGALTQLRGDELARQALRGVLDRVPDVLVEDLDDLILGTAGPEGEQGFNIARVVATLLGYDALPGTTVNRFCASSIQAARMAFHAIRAGEGDAFLVGGTESTSRALPPVSAGNRAFDEAAERTRRAMTEDEPWRDPRQDSEVPDAYIQMGYTAEYVARLTGVTRREQDEFATRSQQLAADAQATGYFAREIVPVMLEDGTVVAADDSLRPSTTVATLAELQPAFSPVGSVTAGNACPLNDGASGALIVSGRYAVARGLIPLARIVSTAVTGLSPEIMGLGPVESSRRALARAGLTIPDLDLIEINEAFAVQVIASARELGIDIDRQLNVHGGAIAIGHPFGATGTRLIGTIINGLQTKDKTLGMATLCVGGGQGMAIVLERLN